MTSSPRSSTERRSERVWVGVSRSGRIQAWNLHDDEDGRRYVSQGGLTPRLIDRDLACEHITSDTPLQPELISIRGGVVRQIVPVIDGCRIETDPSPMPPRFHLFGAPQRQGRKHA